jgi:hypothetical protein
MAEEEAEEGAELAAEGSVLKLFKAGKSCLKGALAPTGWLTLGRIVVDILV